MDRVQIFMLILSRVGLEGSGQENWTQVQLCDRNTRYGLHSVRMSVSPSICPTRALTQEQQVSEAKM